MASTRFRWNGTALSSSDSPRHLCMKDEAFISVAFEEKADESSQESSFASAPSNDFPSATGTVAKAMESLGDGGNLNENYMASQELEMNNNECPDTVDPEEGTEEHPLRKQRELLPLLGVVAAQIQQSQEDPCGQLSPLEQEKIPSEIKEHIIISASAAIAAPLSCQKVVTASPQDDPSARKRCLDMARHDAAAGATPTEEVLRQADLSAPGLPSPDQAGLLVAKDMPATKQKQKKDEQNRDRHDAAAGATPTTGTGSVGQGENGMLERDKDTDSYPAEDEDRDSAAIEKQHQTTPIERGFWECAVCTLHNELCDNLCAACSSPGPRNGLRPAKRARCGTLASSGYITRQNASDYSRLSNIRRGELSSAHDKQLAEPWRTTGEYIGHLLAKSFDSKMYLGQVVATSTATKSKMRLFKVLFQDNDDAVLDEDEVQACFNKLTSRLVAKRNIESLQKYVAAWSHTYVRSLTKAGPGGSSSRVEAHQLRQQFEAGMSRSIDLMQLGCERASAPELRELERLFVECSAGKTDSPLGARKRVRERITQVLDSDDDECPPESLGDGGNLSEIYTGSQELKMNNNECPDAVDPEGDKEEHPVRREREPLPLLGVVAAQIQQSQEDPCGQLSPLKQGKIPSEIKEQVITSASAAIAAPLSGQKVVTASPQDDPSPRKRCLDMARRDAAAGATPTTGTENVSTL